jgi:uncharacterized OsmC-like protein
MADTEDYGDEFEEDGVEDTYEPTTPAPAPDRAPAPSVKELRPRQNPVLAAARAEVAPLSLGCNDPSAASSSQYAAAPAMAKSPVRHAAAMPRTEGGSGESAVTRHRSRLRLSQKSVPNLKAAGARPDQLTLPAIGSGSAISSEMVGASEDFASEQLTLAVYTEMQAQEQLRKIRARVQRELRRASSLSALSVMREKKLEAAKAMRADNDKRIGRDLTERIKKEDLPPATEEEVKELSTLFNKQLEMFHPDARNFFALFKHIDGALVQHAPPPPALTPSPPLDPLPPPSPPTPPD